MNNTSPHIIYVMGVSGVGKSTIGKLLADTLTLPFFDGDDYHPESNIAKMKEGHSLNDTDRHGWLQKLNEIAKKHSDSGAIIVCSALKEKYRTLLNNGLEDKVVWVYLEGSFDEIMDRLQKRKGHYMPSKLLKSQFDTLEVPENAITVPIHNTPENIVSEIINQLHKK